ncbi:restriction endonuclease subunit S [Streptomyces sp. SLBN-134]|uniref:restriction endonuclease subunit S n=1 Tax=Streptomyces sp. SLBN-134 TaxID=2768456 RepID=UPI00114FA349|nr:restriction endonuclease subunit S [Streptomyces sp. SLBN-134]TQL21233.1 type I restriction modification DNA specificity protein [Streptomyces sp. SLBN-134]
MPSSQSHRLIDLCEIITGPSGQQLGGLSMSPEGVPVVSPSDLTTEHKVDASNIKRVSRWTAAALERFQLRRGDVVYVRQGTPGGALGRTALIGYAEATWLFGAACLRVRPRTAAILPQYLLHYLGHPLVHDRITSQAHRSQTVETLPSRALAMTPVFVPSLERQRNIAGALNEIDTQIEAHRQLITKHDALRQGLLTDLLSDAFAEPGTP